MLFVYGGGLDAHSRDVVCLGLRREFHCTVSAAARFASVEEQVERSLAVNPGRDRHALLHGYRYSLRSLPDESWSWKQDRRIRSDRPQASLFEEQRGLWRVVSRVACPTLVVRGVCGDILSRENAEELVARLPDAALVSALRECLTGPAP